MTDKSASPEAEPLLAVDLGPGKVKFAQGMKAGRWVFATGLMAQDFKTASPPDVLAEQAPHAGLPKREKEALRIFEKSTRCSAPPAPTGPISFAPTSTTRR